MPRSIASRASTPRSISVSNCASISASRLRSMAPLPREVPTAQPAPDYSAQPRDLQRDTQSGGHGDTRRDGACATPLSIRPHRLLVAAGLRDRVPAAARNFSIAMSPPGLPCVVRVASMSWRPQRATRMKHDASADAARDDGEKAITLADLERIAGGALIHTENVTEKPITEQVFGRRTSLRSTMTT
jgi:hypothetical protein